MDLWGEDFERLKGGRMGGAFVKLKIYSHRQNYRKKQNGKMPGYYPGNPQMIKKSDAYWCPGNLSLPG